MHIPYINCIHKVSLLLIILLFSSSNIFAQTTFLSKVLNDTRTYLKTNDIENAQKHYKIYLDAGGVKDDEIESFFNGLGQLLEKANKLYENKRYKEALSTLSTIPDPYCNTQWRNRCEEIVMSQKEGKAVTQDMSDFVNSKNGKCQPFVDGYTAIITNDSIISFDCKLVSAPLGYEYSNHRKSNPHFKSVYDKDGKIKTGVHGDLFDLIDSHGRILKRNIEFYGNQVDVLSDDAFWIFVNKKSPEIQIMNLKGEVLSKDDRFSKHLFEYDRIRSFHPFCNGLSRMAITPSKKTYYYYVNKDMENAFSGGFDNALDFSEGLAAVCKDGLWGYINTRGILIIPYKYLLAGRFSEGFAAVKNDKSEIMYINVKDEPQLVLPSDVTTSFEGQDHDWHVVESQFSNGYIIIHKDGRSGYMDKYGISTFDY